MFHCRATGFTWWQAPTLEWLKSRYSSSSYPAWRRDFWLVKEFSATISFQKSISWKEDIQLQARQSQTRCGVYLWNFEQQMACSTFSHSCAPKLCVNHSSVVVFCTILLGRGMGFFLKMWITRCTRIGQCGRTLTRNRSDGNVLRIF